MEINRELGGTLEAPSRPVSGGPERIEESLGGTENEGPRE